MAPDATPQQTQAILAALTKIQQKFEQPTSQHQQSGGKIVYFPNEVVDYSKDIQSNVDDHTCGDDDLKIDKSNSW